MFIDALDESRRHVDADRAYLFGLASVFIQIGRKAFNRAGILGGRDEHDSPCLHVGDQRQILMATPVRGFVNCHRRHARQVSCGECQLDIARADGVYPMPREVDGTGDSGKRHLLGEHQYEGFEQKREAAELPDPTSTTSRK